MSYETNVYYKPEVHGLEEVAFHDFSSGCYEFDFLVLWKSEDGAFYIARDSGCSCPSPFETYTSLDDLDRIFNLDELGGWNAPADFIADARSAGLQ